MKNIHIRYYYILYINKKYIYKIIIYIYLGKWYKSVTRGLARLPPEALLADFGWSLSLSRIANSGRARTRSIKLSPPRAPRSSRCSVYHRESPDSPLVPLAFSAPFSVPFSLAKSFTSKLYYHFLAGNPSGHCFTFLLRREKENCEVEIEKEREREWKTEVHQVLCAVPPRRDCISTRIGLAWRRTIKFLLWYLTEN